MPSRKHTVIAACVITVVLVALTARGHRHSDGRAGAAATPTTASATSAGSSSSRPAGTATPTATPSATSSSPSAAERAQAAVRRLTTSLTALFGAGDSYSVAGYDLSTKRSIAAGAGSGMTEASLVKLDILSTTLYRKQLLGNDFDEDDVVAMIEHSDNAAADRVFADAGRNSGLRQYNSAVGLAHTALDPDGLWGLSTTTATDQLMLLKQLVGGALLSSSSRAYALQLMGNVESDQQWGISAAADPNAPSQLKNGWLNIDRDNGLWAVNSAGVTTSGGHKVLLVVLSQHQPNYRTGVNRVEAAARQLAAALRGLATSR
jgi:hypothetical protein